LAAILVPSRSKLVKCPVEKSVCQSSGGRKHKNQGYFLIPSKLKLLWNSMPINAANIFQAKTKIKNYIERLSFTINLPRSCLFHHLRR
jgi:hypothetical protein